MVYKTLYDYLQTFIKYIDIYKHFDIIDIYHDKTIFESEGLL